MSRQARRLSETGYFHVIVRGIGKQLLFEHDDDYRYYLMLLERYISQLSVSVCAYCLMENHVHLLLKDSKNELSLFMKKMGVSYSSYFNKKYDRTGHLFQDRFFSRPIDDDSYFLSVNRYILTNPQRAGIAPFVNYRWSSIKAFGNKSSFVDTSLISDMLGSYEGYIDFLSDFSSEERVLIDNSKMRDEEARKVLEEILGVSSGVALQSYESSARNEAVIKLSKSGMSERQIERLTGISRRIVHEILW